jgi:hypothetical protein
MGLMKKPVLILMSAAFGLTGLAGCSAKPAKSAPLALGGPTLTEPSSQYSVDLNSLVQQNVSGRSFLGLPEVKALSEADMLELKAHFRRQSESKNGGSHSVREILSAMKKADLKSLENAGLDAVLRATDRLSSAQTQRLTEAILAPDVCAPGAVSLAFASQSERNFPEAAAKEKAVALYSKTYSCGRGEFKARAAYRLALFALTDGNCEKSLQYWPAVIETNEVKFLFSRAQYWKNFCEAEKSDRKQLAIDLYQSFPLSYHAIRELQDEHEDIAAVIVARATPKALVRTQKDEKLNRWIEQVELALETKDLAKARRYLSMVPDETWQEVEPHFLLYIAHLASMTQYGLVTFQSLARALSQNPSLKSITTMKMFYPKWFFAEIEAEAQKNSLDPLLVMSLVRQESAFDRGAISRVGARGLMQLMPGTARSFKLGLTKRDLLNPQKNLQVGTLFLSKLLRRYDGNLVLALAAYNAGPLAVDRWVVRYQVKNPVLFKDLIPYRETREYVASILRNLYWYQMIENQNKPETLAAQKVTQK